MDWRREWFDFGDVTYLNAAWQGPLPRASASAVEATLEWKKYPFKIPHLAYFDLADRTRALIARLINGKPNEIAITTGASSGFAAVASSLDWKPADEVLVARGDFVAHLATWGPLAQAGRLQLKTVAPKGVYISSDDFIAEIGPCTRLVSASLVQPYDGTLLDARKLADACHAVGAYLLLDVSQCLGAMPLDVRTLGADFITSAGYKWLLGPYGTGLFWLRAELVAEMLPGPVYWTALEGARNPQAPTGLAKVVPAACRWDAAETSSFFNLSALSSSLDLILRAEPATVWEHNRRLIAHMIAHLPPDKCVLASPQDSRARAAYACIKGHTVEATEKLYENLRRANINISIRNGALRVAPHLYNTVRDIDRLLANLAQ
jgi:selenocysteine lyase/cysteine desulfurase